MKLDSTYHRSRPLSRTATRSVVRFLWIEARGNRSTGEHLLARVKGLPSPEQALPPPSSAAHSQGREIEARSRRARRADRRQGPGIRE